jgi:hypothetical protein
MSWCSIFDHTGSIVYEHNTCDGSIAGITNGSRASAVQDNIFINSGYLPYSANYNGDLPGKIDVADHNLLYEPGRTYVGSDFPKDIINQDPKFVNLGSLDYHLQSASPAKDAGANVGVTVDHDGAIRPQGTGYDIGAYEFNSGAPPPPSGSACDVNGDSVTNVVDVQQEVNQALGIASCKADINKDGQCTVVDVQRVVNAALGGQCVSP